LAPFAPLRPPGEVSAGTQLGVAPVLQAAKSGPVQFASETQLANAERWPIFLFNISVIPLMLPVCCIANNILTISK